MAALKRGRGHLGDVGGRQHELRGVAAALVPDCLDAGRLLTAGVSVGLLGLAVTRTGVHEAVARTDGAHREGESHETCECRSATGPNHDSSNMHVLR